MKVLLLNPPIETNDGRAMQPLGLAYLAAVCQQTGIEVAIQDANCPSQRDQRDPCAGLIAHRPDVLGVTVYSRSVPFLHSALPRLKAHLPDLRIVAGGPCATIADAALLARVPEIDVVVRGEGEVTFREWLQVMRRREAWRGVAGISFRENGTLYRTQHRDALSEAELSALPFPARQLLPALSDYHPPGAIAARRATNLSRSRGCTRGCGFCSISALCAATRSGWRCRDAHSVLDEMTHLASHYSIEQVYFCDDDFLHSPEKVSAFCRAKLRHGPHLAFSFSASVESVLRAKELLPLLRQAGAQVAELGLESGSDRALARLGKRTRAAQNEAAVRVVRQAGLSCRPDLILFDPDTTPQEIAETLAFLRRVGLFGHPEFLVLGNRLQLYPGTPLRTRLEVDQAVDSDPLRLPEWKFTDPNAAEIHARFTDFLALCSLKILRLAGALSSPDGTGAPPPRLPEMGRLAAENRPGRLTGEHLALLNRLFSVPYELLERLALSRGSAAQQEVASAVDALDSIAAYTRAELELSGHR